MTVARVLCGGALVVGLLMSVGGCYTSVKPATKSAVAPGHDHPDEGPHHGALAEWGQEDYHAEFTVDHQTKQATVYLLGPDAKKPAPIKERDITIIIKNVTPPVTINLKATPEKDDPPGTASRFVGKHDILGKEMEFAGEINGMVEGKAFIGDFKEKPHKDHKHEKK